MAKILIFGSTGRTGRHLVTQALHEGHAVTAFARDPAEIETVHPRLRIVRGDALDPAFVDPVVEGHDAVVSALGPTARRPEPVIAHGTRNILDAMERHRVRRIVVLSAAGALREPAGSWMGAMGLWLARRALPAVFQEHRRMLEDLRRRDLEWIAVRAVLLNDGPKTGNYRIGMEGIPRWGFRISRADAADFMMSQIASDAYVRKLPAIAY